MNDSELVARLVERKMREVAGSIDATANWERVTVFVYRTVSKGQPHIDVKAEVRG